MNFKTLYLWSSPSMATKKCLTVYFICNCFMYPLTAYC